MASQNMVSQGMVSQGMASQVSGGTGIALFDLADRRLSWLGAREGVLSQNVANANTPGWKPRDLQPFASYLTGTATTGTSLVQTNAMHLKGTLPDAAQGKVQPEEQAPDGNAVSLDEQLVKIAQTDTDHQLVSTVYTKYLGMLRMALGR
jgi:flagellar basal-body rod protein FlgB